MKKMIDLASMLGTKVLVFGSPKNRIVPDTMSEKEAGDIAIDFFSSLGEYAHEHSVIIGLEANPPAYGGNFITNTHDAAMLVRDVDNPGFRLHIDAGTLIFENEDLRDIMIRYRNLICHYHVSQPHLLHF
jgi:D-psicose/D-tagatose/L-ribulose 3-epimerase